MDLECITLSEMSQRKTKTERKTNTVCFHFYVEPKIKQNRNRLTETENKLLFINGETTGGGARQIYIYITYCGI